MPDGMVLVQQISEVEAIFGGEDPMGKKILSHQWLKDSPLGLDWSPCCPPVPERFGVGAIQCGRVGKVKEILETEGQAGMIRRSLSR